MRLPPIEDVDRYLELGFTHLSVGFNRFAHPPTPHHEHLTTVVRVRDGARAITG